MEIKDKLYNPYSEDEKYQFIIKNNHTLGYEIKETDDALEAWGYTDAEFDNQEKDRISKLCLTAADVERGIYQARGIDFDDVINLINNDSSHDFDVKALKIELKANHFYRGNSYVDAIGKLLGFSEKQLDLFFEDGCYEHLLV